VKWSLSKQPTNWAGGGRWEMRDWTKRRVIILLSCSLINTIQCDVPHSNFWWATLSACLFAAQFWIAASWNKELPSNHVYAQNQQRESEAQP